MYLYWTNGSKISAAVQSWWNPSGSYTTIKSWIKTLGVKANNVVTRVWKTPKSWFMHTFDNEQFLGWVRSIGTDTRSQSSVITTHMVAELNRDGLVQDGSLKPTQISSVKDFYREAKAVKNIDKSVKSELLSQICEKKSLSLLLKRCYGMGWTKKQNLNMEKK